MLRFALATVLCNVLTFLSPSLATAAGFDCSKTENVTETLICGDPQLSALDDRLAILYRIAKAKVRDPVAFRKETNQQWRHREACADRDCLLGWYQRRNAQLDFEIASESRTAPSSSLEDGRLGNVGVMHSPVHSTEVRSKRAAPATGLLPGAFFALVVIGGTLGLFWNRKQTIQSKKIASDREAFRAKANALWIPVAHVAPRPPETTIREASLPMGGEPVPERKKQSREMATVWIRPDQTVSVNGISIPGGMMYIGSSLVSGHHGVEPAQIDPALEIGSEPEALHERLFGHWPSYANISPLARRTYLEWLADGRRAPSADIGYIFLFFYGLERRVLIDAPVDGTAHSEISVIVAEIERLRSIYDNNSFLRYSSDLLDFLAAGAVDAGLYLSAAPPATANHGLSTRLRVGLGQCAVDGRLVPTEWALAWARSDANMKLPRAATRCARQFDLQFKAVYADKFGEGLTLEVNRTKLAIAYRPASGGLNGQSFSAALGGLPDVTTVIAPLKKLQSVVDVVGESLEPYSRFIARHADRVGSMEATLLLPTDLWPSGVREAVATLDERVGTGMIVATLEELFGAFGGASTLSRSLVKHLLEVLHERQIGVEPDVLSGARTPRMDESVVLFRLAEESAARSGTTSGYEATAVMLDLALTLANADGKISGREVMFLNAQVDAWAHVGPAAQRRLRARLRLGIIYPPSLASLRHRVEPLPKAARAGLAKLLSGLAMADGKLRPSSVKHLERIYALLGIERSVLYNELHVESATRDQMMKAELRPTGGTPAEAPQKATFTPTFRDSAGTTSAKVEAREPRAANGLGLDLKRVAELQAESERVTALLSKVFEERDATAPVPVLPEEAAESVIAEAAGLLGLDAEHSAFLRVLLTRPSWARADLADMASDMELMLDGALERVNEAALGKFDACIAEGDDPVEIAQELMENASA